MNDKEQETARLSGGVRLCAGCRLRPSRPHQRYCPACHARHEKDYYQRRKNYVRELQAIIDGLTGKDPATEDTWRKVVGSRHVLVVPPEDSFADVFAGLVTGFLPDGLVRVTGYDGSSITTHVLQLRPDAGRRRFWYEE